MKRVTEEPTMVVATVSVQDLHEQTEPILRRVAEQGESIAVVDDGKEVARLVPPLPERRPVSAEELAVIRDRRQRLAEEIGAYWPEGVTAEDAVRQQRRDLSNRQPVDPDELDAWLAEVDELAAEIGALWPKGLSAADAIREDRREL